MPKIDDNVQGSNRVQIVHNPPLPGKCAICGYAGAGGQAGEDRDFIDFGLSVDYYGAVVFCEACVVEIAAPLGYVGPDLYDSTVARLQEATALNTKLESDNAQLRGSIGVLAGSLNHVSSMDGAADAAESDSELATPESNSNESASIEGPDDVPSTTGSDTNRLRI